MYNNNQNLYLEHEGVQEEATVPSLPFLIGISGPFSEFQKPGSQEAESPEFLLLLQADCVAV